MIAARVMASLTPGEHVVRLWVGMDGVKPLSATLSIRVEGEGGPEDLLGVEPKYFENFVFLLACGLAQPLSWGVMFLRSPAGDREGEAHTIRVWDLGWGALTECDAERGEMLLGQRVQGRFLDAFGVHSEDDGDEDEGEDGEAVYPPGAYTVR
ncbi:hypothetical protein [Streptomyces sp. NPDC058739]|uniref:hypothetical protein n=1 Tax=Streptomyces sp. NPDC058739 TaxID=3346618 RepID=UPI00369324B5